MDAELDFNTQKMRQQQNYPNQVQQNSKPRQDNNNFKQVASNGKKDQLCKFALTKNCHRGANCSFSHDFSLFPCKYLHGTGMCKVNQCKFKHARLNESELNIFMVENEDFLLKLL